MEVFVVLALVAAASEASADPIDWSKVVPVYDLPQFYDRYPQMTRHTRRPASYTARIVGGKVAHVGQFPYMVVSVTQTPQGTGICGGSLLSNEFVLTAAHCVDVAGEHDFTLAFGAHDILVDEPSRIVVKPVAWVIHEDWDRSLFIKDIAVFRVAPIQFNDRIQPIRLPSRSQQSNSFAGESAIISGWGSPCDYVVFSPLLRFVEQPIITNLLCSLKYLFFIVDSHICMSGKGARGPCSGDSGGPLTVNENDGLPTQVGITSFGVTNFCEKGYPVVFTRVTFFLDWIQANTDVTIRP